MVLGVLAGSEEENYKSGPKLNICSSADLKTSEEITDHSSSEGILYIQRLPQSSSDPAVTGPVEMGLIPMRATASTGGSKLRLYCVTDLHNILCMCVGDAIHASEVRIQ
jgi:hypothetical protein